MIECVIYQRCLYLFIDQLLILHEETLVVYASDPNPTSLSLSLSLSLLVLQSRDSPQHWVI